MPFLRVIRDKRGYETTYLMHWYWDGHRQQGKVLYAFRTPGGVHVGREALEPDVQREIEARYPHIPFDWNAVFQSRQVVDTTVEPRRPRKRVAAEPPVEPRPAPPQQSPARSSIPSTIEGTSADDRVAFLVRWHPVVRERVLRVSDPDRQAALLTLADRMDTAAWTDADQITAGLDAAGEALERLSQLFARRRRRSKKRDGAAADDRPGAAASATDASAPDVPESADADSTEGDEEFDDSSSDA